MEPIALNLMDTHRVRSLQHFVSSGKWHLNILAQRHKEETAKTVGDTQGVFNVDGSDFPKKGKILSAFCDSIAVDLAKLTTAKQVSFWATQAQKGMCFWIAGSFFLKNGSPKNMKNDGKNAKYLTALFSKRNPN